MERRHSPSAARTSRWRSVLFSLVLGLGCLLALELGLRIAFAVHTGPSVLLYGTRFHHKRVHHDGAVGSMYHSDTYMKYYPHQIRYTLDRETGRTIPIHINEQGFRGNDFTVAKKPGVLRVATLGASSTFGFSDRDEETYPSYLERMLQAGCEGEASFEVFNFGIPHLHSGEIVALFLDEVLPLHPDVVTFYEGVNDSWASPVRAEQTRSNLDAVRKRIYHLPTLQSMLRGARDASVTLTVLDQMVKHRRMRFSAVDYRRHLDSKPQTFVDNVAHIYEECRKRGIVFIVCTQQVKSFLVDRETIRGVTYQQERELVRQKLAETGKIDDHELYMLTHGQIMDRLRTWAEENDVPLVDGIAALDQRRDVLVSWVHLNAEGNRLLARALADGILDLTCPTYRRHASGERAQSGQG
jgi:lysophospholipase L1-like esterase